MFFKKIKHLVFTGLTVVACACSSENQIKEERELARSPINLLKTKFYNLDGRTLKIAFIGGSITEGAGCSSFDKSYTSLFVDLVKKEFGLENAEQLNFGIGASTSTYGLARLNTVIASKPDLVVVEFAVNDFGIENDSTVLYNHENILKRLYDEGIPTISLNLNALNGDTESDNIMKVGYHQQHICVRVQTGEGEFNDDVHPNDIGHQKIADGLIIGLKKAVNSNSPINYQFPKPITTYHQHHTVWLPNQKFKSWKLEDNPIGSQSLFSNSPFDTLVFHTNASKIGLAFRRYTLEEHVQNSKLEVYFNSELIKVYSKSNTEGFMFVRSDIYKENLDETKPNELKLIFSPLDPTKNVKHDILGVLLSGDQVNASLIN